MTPLPLQGELLRLKRVPNIGLWRPAVKVNKKRLMAELYVFTGFFTLRREACSQDPWGRPLAPPAEAPAEEPRGGPRASAEHRLYRE